MEQSVTEDTIQDCDTIPTQQSNTKTASLKSIAAGTLKTASLKRRAKSERIAKKKPFNFPVDGTGTSAEKAWDLDEVLAED